MTKFYLISSVGQIERALSSTDGTPHHPTLPGDRIPQCVVNHRRLFVTKEDAISAAGKWLSEYPTVERVAITECHVIGTVSLRAPPVLYTPIRRKRKGRKGRK